MIKGRKKPRKALFRNRNYYRTISIIARHKEIVWLYKAKQFDRKGVRNVGMSMGKKDIGAGWVKEKRCPNITNSLFLLTKGGHQ